MTILPKPCHPDNFSASPIRPIYIVHHCMLGSLVGTDSWFNTSVANRSTAFSKQAKKPTPAYPSSAHFGIGQNGEIHQYVKETQTAFHAGVHFSNPLELGASKFLKASPGINPNSMSIGIEHEGFSNDDWSPAMINSSRELTQFLCQKFNIPFIREYIIGHGELYAPKAKTCPGPKWPIDEILRIPSGVSLT